MNTNKSIFLITGLSAAGKTSIAYRLIEKDPDIEKVITSTSRPIRPGEEHGKDYYFYTKKQMEKMRNEDELYETADVYGNLYGSEKKEVQRISSSGHTPLFVCDVQGLVNLSQTIKNLNSIYVLPDSFENLKKRIENRPGSNPETTLKRLLEAEKELEYIKFSQYCIINKEGFLDDAIFDIEKIIKSKLENNESEILSYRSDREEIVNLIQEIRNEIEKYRELNKEQNSEVKIK